MQNNHPIAEVHIGKVVSVRRWSDTHFEVAGPRRAPRFYTDIEQRQEVFVKDASGIETRWQVPPDRVGFREGSNFLAITGEESDTHNNLIHFVSNPDSGEAYNQPTPIRNDASGFAGFGLGFIVALIVAALFSFASPFLAKNKVGEFKETQAHFLPFNSDVRACPYGTRVIMDHRKPENTWEGCPRGARLLYPPTLGCECAKSSEDFAHTLYAKAQENHSIRLANETTSYNVIGMILGVVVGLIVWFIKYSRTKSQMEDLAYERRKQYAQVIEAEAAKHGVPVEVTDLEQLLLRRRKG